MVKLHKKYKEDADITNGAERRVLLQAEKSAHDASSL